MKKHPTVAAAEAAAQAKLEALESARANLKQLESDYVEAKAAVRAAQAAVDATLPQCRLVKIRWASGALTEIGRAVIERKTPAGKLVVRLLGDPPGDERMFQWRKYSDKFTEAKKVGGSISDQLELRDVPPEFIPASES